MYVFFSYAAHIMSHKRAYCRHSQSPPFACGMAARIKKKKQKQRKEKKKGGVTTYGFANTYVSILKKTWCCHIGNLAAWKTVL